MSQLRIIYGYLLLTFLLMLGANVNAQDLHFSQYFNAPILINPANTGFNPDYDYRVGINYRNQWGSIINNPYKTTSAWGDVQLFNNRFENSWIGLGGAIYQDAAGAASLKATKGYVSVAYHQVLGYSSLLSLGVSAGWVNKRFDASKLTFDNQWNGRFFDVSQPNNEPFIANSVSYADWNIGLNYGLFISEKAYVNAGLSMQHINKPFESFFAATSNNSQQVVPRYNFFVNGNFKVNNIWILNPNVYVSKMATATELVLGLNANRDLIGDGSKQLILGAYYRHKDAIAPMIGYQVADFKMLINYDITVSSLSVANSRQGAYEISIVKNGVYPAAGNKKLKCPTVKF